MSRLANRIYLLQLACCWSPRPALLAEDWPQWRGPNRDGVWQPSAGRDLQGPLELEWSVEIGPGYNGPTVADGRVYVMDRQTAERETERILCYRSSDGQLIWQHEYDARYTISYKAGPRAA